METKKSRKKLVAGIIVIAIVVIMMIIAKITTTADSVQNTAWALLPPVVAIVLALVTKEVHSSLFIGILVGGLLWSGFSFEGTVTHVISDGFIANLADTYNMGIIIFLVVLGIIVALMNKAGGSNAFGEWAATHIKSRRGAMLATIVLGLLIFVDDYFNCLTVGSVMRPVTDKHHVSRAKFSYLIDSTAAPICVIAPISSWAAAVAGFVQGHNGFAVFCAAIPFNFYAIITIVFMLTTTISNTDFGPMAVHEKNAIMKNDLFTTPERPFGEADDAEKVPRARVADLFIPVIILIFCCIMGMLWTGGLFSGESVINAFANSDASLGLCTGSIIALIVILIYYMLRKLSSFTELMECLPTGFKAMVPPILILAFAWTLNGMTSSLGAADFIANLVSHASTSLYSFLPAVIFVIGAFLGFATGTSWGTFGILIPIVVAAFSNNYQMMIIAISACMAGGVCGDHCSPISDTTIMASAGARCYHLNHVSTQLPYVLFVVGVSFVGFVIAGFTRSALISLPIAVALCIIIILFLKKMHPNEDVMPKENA